MSVDPGPDDLIAIAAGRRLRDEEVCFVGVGLPSTAAIIALRTRAAAPVLVYESGILGAEPPWVPLSVADPGLAENALTLVPVPEMFNYWLQGGHVDVGLLGAAQIDRMGNVNSTVIGAYQRPRVRLPGAGGAPEIAAAAGRVILMMRQNARSFVSTVDFLTTVGHGRAPGDRRRMGLRGAGPSAVVTDVGVYEPSRRERELVLTSLQPGRTVEEARTLTPWALAVAEEMKELDPPSAEELAILEDLRESRADRA